MVQMYVCLQDLHSVPSEASTMLAVARVRRLQRAENTYVNNNICCCECMYSVIEEDAFVMTEIFM